MKKIKIDKPFVSLYNSKNGTTTRTYSMCNCCKSCKGK